MADITTVLLSLIVRVTLIGEREGGGEIITGGNLLLSAMLLRTDSSSACRPEMFNKNEYDNGPWCNLRAVPLQLVR